MPLDRLTDLTSSLKLRITAGFIGSLMLAVGVIALLLVNRAERDTLQDETRRELSASVRTASQLSRVMVEMQRALSVVANQLDFATVSSPDALSRFIKGKPVLRSLFSNVFVTGVDGEIIMVADEKGLRDPDYSISDREYFKRTVSEGRALISEPVAQRVTGEPVVVLTQPLRNSDGVFAVLCGSLLLASRDLLASLVDVLASLVDVLETDEQALTVVTDARGQILAHPNRALVICPLSDKPRLAATFTAWVASGSSVEPGGLQLRQAGEVVSAAGVAGPDWMVWRARPESELLAPLHSARRLALLWAGGLITLMSAITLMLVSWLLRPLEVGGEIGRLVAVLKAVGAERVQLEASNAELLRRLGSVMTASPIDIAFTRNQRFELVSTEFCRLFGRSEADFLVAYVEIIYVPHEDYRRVGSEVVQAFEAGESYAGEWPMARADGSQFWARLRGRPVDTADPLAGTIWTVNDISAAKLTREELAWTAGHDALTSLANRRAFERRAEALVHGLPITLPAAIIFIDLYHFKPVNDCGGHAAGDAMLVAVATAISAVVRATDLVVRLSGDEFGVLLERCTVAAALHTAEHILAAVASIRLPWEGSDYRVAASLGVASLAVEMDSFSAWLGVADAACYEAKAAGRGMVRGAGMTG